MKLLRSDDVPVVIPDESPVVWSVETSPDRAHPAYSGQVGRWWRLTLYRLPGGDYVLHECRCSNWQHEADRYAVHRFPDLAAVRRYLVATWPQHVPDFGLTLEVVDTWA
ncbi:MAG: hypothetical protein RMK01_04055 [Thermomicrobium sp.]|nr:hypothetical protein [Thermomicrobium sp.]